MTESIDISINTILDGDGVLSEQELSDVRQLYSLMEQVCWDKRADVIQNSLTQLSMNATFDVLQMRNICVKHYPLTAKKLKKIQAENDWTDEHMICFQLYFKWKSRLLQPQKSDVEGEKRLDAKIGSVTASRVNRYIERQYEGERKEALLLETQKDLVMQVTGYYITYIESLQKSYESGLLTFISGHEINGLKEIRKNALSYSKKIYFSKTTEELDNIVDKIFSPPEEVTKSGNFGKINNILITANRLPVLMFNGGNVNSLFAGQSIPINQAVKDYEDIKTILSASFVSEHSEIETIQRSIQIMRENESTDGSIRKNGADGLTKIFESRMTDLVFGETDLPVGSNYTQEDIEGFLRSVHNLEDNLNGNDALFRDVLPHFKLEWEIKERYDMYGNPWTGGEYVIPESGSRSLEKFMIDKLGIKETKEILSKIINEMHKYLVQIERLRKQELEKAIYEEYFEYISIPRTNLDGRIYMPEYLYDDRGNRIGEKDLRTHKISYEDFKKDTSLYDLESIEESIDVNMKLNTSLCLWQSVRKHTINAVLKENTGLVIDLQKGNSPSSKMLYMYDDVTNVTGTGISDAAINTSINTFQILSEFAVTIALTGGVIGISRMIGTRLGGSLVQLAGGTQYAARVETGVAYLTRVLGKEQMNKYLLESIHNQIGLGIKSILSTNYSGIEGFDVLTSICETWKKKQYMGLDPGFTLLKVKYWGAALSFLQRGGSAFSRGLNSVVPSKFIEKTNGEYFLRLDKMIGGSLPGSIKKIKIKNPVAGHVSRRGGVFVTKMTFMDIAKGMIG